MDCVWPIVFFALSTWVTNSIANINFQRGEQLSSLNFVQINGQYLNVVTAVTMEVKNMFSCAGECRKNTTCSTFNLAKYGETFTCEILPEDLCENRDKLVADSNRQVFYFKVSCSKMSSRVPFTVNFRGVLDPNSGIPWDVISDKILLDF